MTERGISCAAITGDTVRDRPEILLEVEKGMCRFVYATPEALFKGTGHFMTSTCRTNNVFRTTLAAIVIDECHTMWDWYTFRGMYQMVSQLRDFFPYVPIMAMSATLLRNVRKYIESSLRLVKPVHIIRPLRRLNICLIVARIKHKGRGCFEDLNFVIPDNICMKSQISKTLIFVDNVDDTFDIARYLRRCLPKRLKPLAESLIRSYSSYPDAPRKAGHMRDINDGTARVIVTTEAFGMGINVQGINRVIQWKVTDKIDLGKLTQRVGRGGRDPSQQAVAVIFVSDNILPTKRQKRQKQTNPEPPNESPDGPEPTTPVADSQITPSIESVLSLWSYPITPEAVASVKQFMRSTYERTKPPGKGERTSGIEPAVKLVLGTTGCRCQLQMLIFEDWDMGMEWMQIRWCCDNCISQSQSFDEPAPVILGVDLNISVAYESRTKKQNDTAPQTPEGPEVSEARLDILDNELRKWREKVHRSDGRYAYIDGDVYLSDSAIDQIQTRIRQIHSVETLQKALEAKPTRFSFPQALLTPYLPNLYETILQSLQGSQHLEEQLPSQGARLSRRTSSGPTKRSTQRAETLARIQFLLGLSSNPSANPLPSSRVPFPNPALQSVVSASTLRTANPTIPLPHTRPESISMPASTSTATMPLPYTRPDSIHIPLAHRHPALSIPDLTDNLTDHMDQHQTGRENHAPDEIDGHQTAPESKTFGRIINADGRVISGRKRVLTEKAMEGADMEPVRKTKVTFKEAEPTVLRQVLKNITNSSF